MPNDVVADEINRIWNGIFGGTAEPVLEPALLVKRLKLIGEQLKCAEENFRLTNAAYCKLDVETRELRGLHFADSQGRAIPHAPKGESAPRALEEAYRDLMSGDLVVVRGWFGTSPYADQKASQVICRSIHEEITP